METIIEQEESLVMKQIIFLIPILKNGNYQEFLENIDFFSQNENFQIRFLSLKICLRIERQLHKFNKKLEKFFAVNNNKILSYFNFDITLYINKKYNITDPYHCVRSILIKRLNLDLYKNQNTDVCQMGMEEDHKNITDNILRYSEDQHEDVKIAVLKCITRNRLFLNRHKNKILKKMQHFVYDHSASVRLCFLKMLKRITIFKCKTILKMFKKINMGTFIYCLEDECEHVRAYGAKLIAHVICRLKRKKISMKKESSDSRNKYATGKYTYLEHSLSKKTTDDFLASDYSMDFDFESKEIIEGLEIRDNVMVLNSEGADVASSCKADFNDYKYNDQLMVSTYKNDESTFNRNRVNDILNHQSCKKEKENRNFRLYDFDENYICVFESSLKYFIHLLLDEAYLVRWQALKSIERISRKVDFTKSTEEILDLIAIINERRKRFNKILFSILSNFEFSDIDFFNIIIDLADKTMIPSKTILKLIRSVILNNADLFPVIIDYVLDHANEKNLYKREIYDCILNTSNFFKKSN